MLYEKYAMWFLSLSGKFKTELEECHQTLQIFTGSPITYCHACFYPAFKLLGLFFGLPVLRKFFVTML